MRGFRGFLAEKPRKMLSESEGIGRSQKQLEYTVRDVLS